MFSSFHSFIMATIMNTTTSYLSNTTIPDTFMSSFHQISEYNVHLNVFEKLWAAWYAYMQNDVLATGIMSFAMHEIFYFGRCLPWMIIAHIPYFNKYKIQGVRTCFHNNMDPDKILTIRRPKFQQLLNNGTAPNSSFSPTSPSNSHKSGSSTPWPNTLASRPAYPSPPS